MRLVMIFVILPLIASCHKHCNDSIKVNQRDSLLRAYPVWQTYGFPIVNFQETQEIAKTMGFRLEVVGNCSITDSLEKVVKRNNKIVDSVLTKKYGKDWGKILKKSADSLYTVDTIMVGIAESHDYIKRLLKAKNLRYDVSPTQIPHVRMVMGSGLGEINNTKRYLNYFRAAIDFKSRLIINVDTIAIGF